MTERDLYSINEARKRLGGISRNGIYQMLHTGELGSVVIGSRRFIPATAIAQFITKATTTVSPSLSAARQPSLDRHPSSFRSTPAVSTRRPGLR